MRAQISKFISQLVSKLMGTRVLKAALDRLSALRAEIGRDPATDLRRTVTVAVAGATPSVGAALVVAHWESKVAEVAFNGRANNIATTLQTGLKGITPLWSTSQRAIKN